MQLKSLRYLPLYPPKTKRQLPTTKAACLLLADGADFSFTFSLAMALVLGSMTSTSLISVVQLILPAKMYIFPLWTQLLCPHLPSLLSSARHSHLSPSVLPSSSSAPRSVLNRSPSNSQLSLQPPMMYRCESIMTEEWNLLAVGILPSNVNLFHLLVMVLKAQVSSRSRFDTPSPPCTIKQGQWNSLQWQVRSQGDSSDGSGRTRSHFLVGRCRMLTELNRNLLEEPPPKRMTCWSYSLQWMVQLDLCYGWSPEVRNYLHLLSYMSYSQRSPRYLPSLPSPPKPPKSSNCLGETCRRRCPQRSRGRACLSQQLILCH